MGKQNPVSGEVLRGARRIGLAEPHPAQGLVTGRASDEDIEFLIILLDGVTAGIGKVKGGGIADLPADPN